MFPGEHRPRATQLPPAVRRALDEYVSLVAQWAPQLDLVSPGDLVRFRERHVEDSLRALPLLRSLPTGPCIDVGSGAGLPGIPLAMADPDHDWRLLEPRRRRAAFLEEAVRQLQLPCEVIVATAEAAAKDPRLGGTHVLAVGRALAPPPEAFDRLLPLVAPGGVALVFAGENSRLPAEAAEWRPGLATIRRDGRDQRGQ